MFNIKDYLEEINCPNCKENSYKVIKSSDYSRIKNSADLLKIYRSSADDTLFDQMVKCKSCNFQYLNPRVKSKIIEDSYETNIDETHLSQDRCRIKTFKKSINKIMKILNINYFKNYNFLDIGSASGAFLKSIKDFGFKEKGYEPSKWMVEYGKKNYDVNLNQGSIEEVEENEKYDFISFWDVLEHVTDLDETLNKVKKVSKTNTILILNVPNIDSIVCKLMGFNWPFYLNVHLYYFSDNTIKKILRKYNFELIDSFPHFQYLELGYLCFRAKKYLKLFFIIEKIVSILKISKLPIPYNLGQTTFIFQKNNE
tara:strand:+ start:3399 stop:4334 length:936 start_codon:yes stop_codon:yes gene_type:complete